MVRRSGRCCISARRFPARAGIAGLFALSASSAARAEDYPAVPMEPGATLSLWSSSVHVPGRYALALGLQARSLSVPPTIAGDGGERTGSASNLELLGSIGVWRSLDLSAAVALERVQVGNTGEESTQQSSALGDVRVAPRLRLMGNDSGSGLALVVPVWRPGGSLGDRDRTVRVEPRLSGSVAHGAITAIVNLGYQLHTRSPGLGPSSSSAITAGAGAELFIADSWALLGEILGVWSGGDRWGPNSSGVSGEARLGARYARDGWAAQFGAGRGVIGAASEPDWRFIASVSFSPGGGKEVVEAAPAPIASTDPVDAPYLKQEADWHPPEENVASEDAEARSSPAPALEPAAAEPDVDFATALSGAASSEGVNGGDDPDTLETSVPTVQVPEVVVESTDVRPPHASLPRITEIIRFAPNQMQLDTAHHLQLDLVADQMHAAPDDSYLVVAGHSDRSGPSGFNWRLSRMRASTVRYHLILRGIPWHRISVRAYGASRPSAPDAALATPAQNRRVEFLLTRARRP